MLQFDALAVPEAVSAARQTLREWEAIPPERAGDLLIIVSELVNNAVRHAGLRPEDRVSVRLAREEGGVRVEVQDRGRGFDAAEMMSAPLSRNGGYGLRLVDALSEDWGCQTPGCVWARVQVV